MSKIHIFLYSIENKTFVSVGKTFQSIDEVNIFILLQETIFYKVINNMAILD